MSACIYCGNEVEKKQTCRYCGTVIAGVAGYVICDGAGRERAQCSGVLTDRYLILHVMTPGEAAGGAAASQFGLIGALIHAGVSSARRHDHAFYDLRELQKVVFPFYNDRCKKPFWFRFVNRDGTDFILWITNKKAAAQLAEKLAETGVFVENGEGQHYGQQYCLRPAVNRNTAGLRICASAAPFVQRSEKQFVVPPMM